MLTWGSALVASLQEGKIGVIPTDTLYGLVGSALNPDTVERIYKVRKRDANKPFIVLIADISELKRFDVGLSKKEESLLRKCWPGKISVILECLSPRFAYLHRGTKTIAFRLPNHSELRSLLKQTGPLVAPSANIQGKSSATTIDEAEKYFKDFVDFYVDGGKLSVNASTVVSLQDGIIEVIRQGEVEIK